jgi:hypothetical protein
VLNEISTPRSPFVANVRPRSVIASRAGPAVFQNAYGPVTAMSAMFASGAETRQWPKRASTDSSPTSTHALAGVMPNARASVRYAGANAKSKRSAAVTGAAAAVSARPNRRFGFDSGGQLGSTCGCSPFSFVGADFAITAPIRLRLFSELVLPNPLPTRRPSKADEQTATRRHNLARGATRLI